MANSVSRTLILDEIARRGWHSETIGSKGYFLKITHPDGRSAMLRGSRPAQTTAHGFLIAMQKNLTMDFAQSLGFDVVASQLVLDESEITDFLARYKRIVVKPADGERTQGVTVNLTSPDQVPAAYQAAMQNSRSGRVIVQQHLDGNLYRILIINGNFAAALLREPAMVTGDGVQTVEALIAQANLDPRRQQSSVLKEIDAEKTRAFIGDERFTSVPAINESVIVAKIISMGTGGEAVTVTDEVHSDWRRASERFAREAGLYVCGFDIICADISEPMEGNYLPLIEVNSEPSLGMHDLASKGQPTHVSGLLLDALLPEVK